MYPSSIRLVDNIQFKFGQSLKPEEMNKWKKYTEMLKKLVLFKVYGFDIDQLVAATCLFEGPKDICTQQMTDMFAIAAKYGGISGGAENGLKGYQLTYMIAYIRDFIIEFGAVAESFETSCPWSQVSSLCKNVKQGIFDAMALYGQQEKDVFVSFRVTQLYETGAAVYVYFAMKYEGFPENKICDIYEDVEHRSRECVFENGGSISHHHGVGKLRKRFMEKNVSNLNSQMMEAIKYKIDPKNIFAINNTIYRSKNEKEIDQ